ncbi:MAG: hypothetical protein GWN87_00405 [Desulfuromonadales bacterium]|nr:hypothetical protein [Desulfuromonadales bacterium]NIS39236.1 hypothetical protein [Desulfuromonadales bacterium]
MKQQAVFRLGLAVFSGLVSFMFVFNGVTILTAAHVPEWAKVYAYVCAGYGLGNVYILSSAWRTNASWAVWANKLIASCYFGVFLIDRWKGGMESAVELIGIAIVAAVLWFNWYAVREVCRGGE